MTPYDKNQIWNELRRLDKEKLGTCSFKDLMDRHVMIHNVLNETINRLNRLEDEVNELRENNRDVSEETS